MSKVFLRVYNHEIESMIESGQLEEAVCWGRLSWKHGVMGMQPISSSAHLWLFQMILFPTWA